MTPQERQLVSDLFDRLAALENAPRDGEAERAIRDGLARAPNAVYALVQSVLVQDEALRQADARIRELEEGPRGHDEGQREPRSFLDNMRDALLGERGEARGSVPAVNPQNRPMGVPPQFDSRTSAPGHAMPNDPAAASPGHGGSFLGTAAAAAAGMVGGALLLDGIRSMLGGQNKGSFAGMFDRTAGEARSPWGSEAAGGSLAQAAGIDDIGSARAAGLFDANEKYAGLFNPAKDEAAADDADDSGDFGDDFGDFGGDSEDV